MKKELYKAFYGINSLHCRIDTARGLYNYLKRVKNKVDMLIDSLEIYPADDLTKHLNLSDLYTESEIDEIFGY